MSKKYKVIRKRTKIQKPITCNKWNKQTEIYHNKGSKHFLLSVESRGDYAFGHDMTTSPSLTKDNQPRKRYMALYKNPNPKDKRTSYIHKNPRIVKKHFEDSGDKRLTKKREWKVHKKDKRVIKKLNKKKLKNPHNSV